MAMYLENLYPFAILSAFLLGVSKAGFKGLGFLVVTFLALAIEAKESTGVLLPMLIFADIMAIIYYRRDVDKGSLFKILPAMLIGVLLGSWIGEKLPIESFKYLMAGIIMSGLVLMIYFEYFKKIEFKNPKKLAYVLGSLAGIATMIGNLAGAFSNLYFLLLRFKKELFIGTTAWLFFFVNIFKLPIHIYYWETVNNQSINISLLYFPFVFVGFLVGIRFIKYISNEFFRKYIIIMTLIGVLFMLFK